MKLPICARAACAPALAAALLGGCGGVNLWPFGESTTAEVGRKPTGAAEYRCDEGKTFYVRNLDGGAVWLIAPDREIRLGKQADGSYGAGRVALTLAAEGATLADPPARFANCKRAALP